MIKGQLEVQPREIEAAFDSCSLPFYGSFLLRQDAAGPLDVTKCGQKQ